MSSKPFEEKPFASSVKKSVEQLTESSTLSIWKHTAAEDETAQTYPSLVKNIDTDIAVVGAGITGVTTALLLQQTGYDVVLVDSHPVGFGVSGFNSGHLTSMMLDSRFHRVVAGFGEEAVRIVTHGVRESIDFVERLVRDFRIDCDFKRIPGYLYAEQTAQLAELRDEYEAATRAGLPLNRTFNVPLPFGVEEALQVPDQARFHPLRYVQALARVFARNGGRIFTNSRILQIDHLPKNTGFRIVGERGEIYAQETILATHTPIGFRPAIQARLEAIRSYVIGIRSDAVIGDALYWDMDSPYHYMRLVQDENGPLIMIGGEDHKVGEQPGSAEYSFRRLESYAMERFNVKSVDYRWSAHFYAPADGLPYIGKLSGVYVATGFSGEGLTFGTLAARIIRDQICGIQNPCHAILQPGRTKPLASASGVFSESVNTMSHFFGDRLRKPELSDPAHVSPGEGAICQVDGKKVAVYHSPEGVRHVLSPICTHMNCVVGWNAVEKSWDCPCHGGRFDATGKVLNGPPVVDLETISIQED